MAGERPENIIWEPLPGPQTALISCPVAEVFFGGARGGGKTDGVLGDWLRHSADHGENAIGLMVRRTLVELTETIERSKVIFGRLGATYSEQQKMWRMPNGARLRFAYLERDADADGYQGHSYTRVYVEEIGNFPDPKPVLKLMATLRSGAGVPCGFRATGNPGGVGHGWVKARYIDPAPLGMQIVATEYRDPWTGQSVTRERVFIPSRLRDNTYLGADYVANLQMQGSETLVRAWLEGDWTVIEGAFFDKWSARNILRPLAMPAEWTRFRSMDWGFAAPFSVGWWCVVGEDLRPPGTAQIVPRGSIVRYREWYGASAPNVGLRMPAEDIAAGILSRETGERIDYGVLDPAAFTSDGGPSIAERLRMAGAFFRPADNRRVSTRGAIGGWDMMRGRIAGDGHGPRLFVFDTCKDFLRTVPVQQHDRDRAEDIDTDGEDHVADEARYACLSRPWVSMPEPAPDYAERTIIVAQPDGTVRSNTSPRDFALRRAAERKRTGRPYAA